MYERQHYLVTIGGTLAGGEIWQTGCRFASLDAHTDQDFRDELPNIGVQDIYDDAATLFTLANTWPTTTVVRWAKVAAIGTNGLYLRDPILYESPTGQAGPLGTKNPNQICLVASLWTGSTFGKGNYGRMYFPGPGEDVGTDGRWNDTRTDAWAAAIETMLQAWAGEVSTVGIAAGQLSIMAQGVTPATNAVNWIRVGRVPDTQRRRRNDLVEDYSDVAHP